jgi:hypothetical protein
MNFLLEGRARGWGKDQEREAIRFPYRGSITRIHGNRKSFLGTSSVALNFLEALSYRPEFFGARMLF